MKLSDQAGKSLKLGVYWPIGIQNLKLSVPYKPPSLDYAHFLKSFESRKHKTSNSRGYECQSVGRFAVKLQKTTKT